MHFNLKKLSSFAISLWCTLLISIFLSDSALAVQEYRWEQGNNPTPMIGTSEGVCFLTTVSGKFEGGGEQVGVYIENNQWFLGGKSQQSGVRGVANCVKWTEIVVSARSVSGPYTWTQGQPTTYLNGFNEGNGFCFLAGVSGKFAGGGESVEVALDRNREWLFGGASLKWDVSGTAYCIPTAYNYTKLTSQLTWTQGAPQIILGSNYAFCFLTRMQGNYQGGKEIIEISNNLGEWYLGGSSGGRKNRLEASARCYKK